MDHGGWRKGFVLAASAAFLAAAPAASAATIPVSITADTSGAGDCSLREAVSSANANTNLANGCVAGESGNLDTITLSATTGADTYMLTGATLENANVSGDLDLTANDAGVLIRGDTDVDGNPLDRISGGNNDRVIEVVNTTAAPLTLESLIVENGNPPPGSFDTGGGIASLAAPLQIVNSQVRTSTAASGGGVFSLGPLTITDSLIGDDTFAEGNSARIGAGVFAQANATIERSRLAFNSAGVNLQPGVFDSLAGGGLYASGGTATVIDSEIVSNRAAPTEATDGPRGAGLVTDNANLVVKGSTISGNQVIGGANGNSAGVALGSGSAHTAALVNSTISGNSVDNTGSGTRSVGGLLAPASVTTRLIHVTVAGNAAPATAAIQGGSHLTLKGSVIDQPEAASCFGVFTADAFNVGAGENCIGPAGDSDIVSTSAAINLLALASNGGPTQTRALGPGSTAENVVPVAACLDENDSALLVDQRGFPRPAEGGCEAGAYERFICDGVELMQPGPFPGCAPPTTPGGGQTTTPLPPSNGFVIDRVKRNKKKGTATIFLTLPGPGEIGLDGKGLKEIEIEGASAAQAVSGGEARLKVRPAKKGKQARRLRDRLDRKGKAKVKVFITFIPTGGLANTQTEKLKLIDR